MTTPPPDQPQQPYGQQPQQPYGQQPYPPQGYPQQPPQKKRKKWPWIVGGIILVFILIIGGCVAIVGSAVNEVDKESKSEVAVTYRVTGTGGPATIMYSDANFNTAQDTQAALPWEKNVTLVGFGKIASLTASSDFQAAGDVTIKCEILVGGAVKFTQTANGPGATASCTGDVSD